MKTFLKSPMILNYLENNDDDIDTLITCNPENKDLVTSDYEIYEALATLKKENFSHRRLTKFFEMVHVVSYRNITGKQKPVIMPQRITEVRNSANKVNNYYGG